MKVSISTYYTNIRFIFPIGLLVLLLLGGSWAESAPNREERQPRDLKSRTSITNKVKIRDRYIQKILAKNRYVVSPGIGKNIHVARVKETPSFRMVISDMRGPIEKLISQKIKVRHNKTDTIKKYTGTGYNLSVDKNNWELRIEEKEIQGLPKKHIKSRYRATKRFLLDKVNDFIKDSGFPESEIGQKRFRALMVVESKIDAPINQSQSSKVKGYFISVNRHIAGLPVLGEGITFFFTDKGYLSDLTVRWTPIDYKESKIPASVDQYDAKYLATKKFLELGREIRRGDKIYLEAFWQIKDRLKNEPVITLTGYAELKSAGTGEIPREVVIFDFMRPQTQQ